MKIYLVAFLLAVVGGLQSLAQSDAPLGERQVIVLATKGTVEVSTDGKNFKTVRAGSALKQGAIFRTRRNSHADLFFRRIGTMVRLMPESEMKVENLSWQMKDDTLVKDTLLDLTNGRMLAFIRVLVADSTFGVRNERGIAKLVGSGTGRYDIRADGTFISGRSSRSPLKVILEGKETVIEPGQKFSAKERKLSPLVPSEAEVLVIELDELETLAQQLSPEPTEQELPRESRKKKK